MVDFSHIPFIVGTRVWLEPLTIEHTDQLVRAVQDGVLRNQPASRSGRSSKFAQGLKHPHGELGEQHTATMSTRMMATS